MQEDITRAISARLRERLSNETTKQVAKGGTADPEAYQLYLKGRFYWDKRTPDSLEKARDFFNQAIEKDPNYALAYLGLADYYDVVTEYAPIPVSETLPKARAATQKALAIDDSLAEAHALLGDIFTLQTSYWHSPAVRPKAMPCCSLQQSDVAYPEGCPSLSSTGVG